MAERHMAAEFNRPNHEIIHHYTYIISGDGCMMEGINYEAASLAGTLGLGKLIVLYDSNSITIEGSTDIAFTEDVSKRFEAMGWETFHVEDGNDIKAIENVINKAKENLNQPSLIKITTEIGYGTSKQGKSSVHGSPPLGNEDMKNLKEFLDWKEEEFTVPSEVQKHMAELVSLGEEKERQWEEKWEAYKKRIPRTSQRIRNVAKFRNSYGLSGF